MNTQIHFHRSTLMAAVLSAALLSACAPKAPDEATVDPQVAAAAAKAEEAELKAQEAEAALAKAEAERLAAVEEAKAAQRKAERAQAAASKPAPPPPKPVCIDCGTVAAITPVQLKGEGSGIGVALGAIAGVAAGNQVGAGKGTDVAKVVGAIGGGFAGNEIEKRVRGATAYDVTVRLDDGGSRVIRVTSTDGLVGGERVRVSGNSIVRL